MTKPTMPEPVAFLFEYKDGQKVLTSSLDAIQQSSKAWTPLITTTQAEAYADARVVESQQWISVDEEMPPDDQTAILAVHSRGEIEIVWGQLVHETYQDDTYPHWMPLPAPPR